MSVRRPDRAESLIFVWILGSLALLIALPWLLGTSGVPGDAILAVWGGAGVLLLIGLLIARHWRGAGLLVILTFALAFLSPLITSLGASFG